MNHPEAVALIATQILEFIRDGRSVAELMDVGRQLLGRAEVMPHVPNMVAEVQVEGTFPDGSKLVTIHNPIVAEHGNLDLALYGSFLPVPSRERFAASAAAGSRPGEVLISASESELVLNEGRATVQLRVVYHGDRPIQVGSHYHFAETNRALMFDRAAAYGCRLDIPAGTAVRFEPGESRTVRLVAIAGRRIVRGGNALASGPVRESARSTIGADARRRDFGHREEGS